MTKFVMGLLLGLILGIAGTSAFLITAQGGDYLVATSPRVRELEAVLKQGDSEREWLRHQLREASESMTRLESRFLALSERFEKLGVGASQAAAEGAGASRPDEPTAPGTPVGEPTPSAPRAD